MGSGSSTMPGGMTVLSCMTLPGLFLPFERGELGVSDGQEAPSDCGGFGGGTSTIAANVGFGGGHTGTDAGAVAEAVGGA